MKITARPLEPQVIEAIRQDEADTLSIALDRQVVEAHAAARTADSLTKIAKSLESLTTTMASIERALWQIAPERIDL